MSSGLLLIHGRSISLSGNAIFHTLCLACLWLLHQTLTADLPLERESRKCWNCPRGRGQTLKKSTSAFGRTMWFSISFPPTEGISFPSLYAYMGIYVCKIFNRHRRGVAYIFDLWTLRGSDSLYRLNVVTRGSEARSKSTDQSVNEDVIWDLMSHWPFSWQKRNKNWEIENVPFFYSQITFLAFCFLISVFCELFFAALSWNQSNFV